MSDAFVVNNLPDRTITYQEREYLFFSGTAYLGLPQHPAFQQLFVESVGRYGTVFGSSRNGNLQLGIYEEAEAKLAQFVGAENVLTLSSGMMAGQAVVNVLRLQKTELIYGPCAHPAIWDGPATALPSMSFADWAAQLPAQVQTMPAGPLAILLNSIEAVRSEYYTFEWVNALPDDRAITLVIDDSHGLGVLNNGRGIWPQVPKKPNVNLIVTASTAKAMGLPGGAIIGRTETLAATRKTAFFGACSPIPPAYLDAYLRADALYADRRDKLQQNLLLAEKLLIPTGLFTHAKGYPVFFTEQDDLYPFLLERGIFIYSFAYPTATDRANSRIVISAFHEFADIQKLAEAIYTYSF
ncbi:aminotransferase class I/II-fold pyridoxal phosphate-dependent enzyme [Spirosoma sp. RP8]|uniref:Aminotransferase class I/II-fold pyridoxal phosphate-dependent enzyme n=1 Tax=Spirosoma liriopis TaxID=2937440 RepID=A0ABT0HKV0_9BACT|nr:aminotransferase class I/II-fold pyridoxal phosphate-dependent enzyme [Spirosoma liriopis]MCK8492789.1 aminotransferase class I/II-fold pyridoxal phosphate-dependent enzyme [Spirosoma liriopis]